MKRNDPCWCGSGKKYKKCHLEHDEKMEAIKQQGYEFPPKEIIKTAEEIEGIKESGRITRDILDMLESRIEAGISTEQINQWVHEYTLEQNAIPAPLNYNGFPKSTCTSINDVVCHGIPDDTVLQEGDIINVDITTIHNGYFADASRMYMVGEIHEEAEKLVKTAKECLELGIQAVKPFEPLNNIGKAIEPYANELGYSVVRDLGGHGIGKEFHEFPQVNHFVEEAKGVVLMPGMVLTIEPMINQGTSDVFLLEDEWTVVTADGGLSAQWEHTIVVTEDGCEILT